MASCTWICCSQVQSWQVLGHELSKVVPSTVGPWRRRMTHDKSPAECLNLFGWLMIPLHHWRLSPFDPHLQRPRLTFWQERGAYIPSRLYLGLTNHLSSLQSYHLLNYRWEVCICSQKPGPVLLKHKLAPSFQGHQGIPTARFPRAGGLMKNASFPKHSVFSDWRMATNNVQ